MNIGLHFSIKPYVYLGFVKNKNQYLVQAKVTREKDCKLNSE